MASITGLVVANAHGILGSLGWKMTLKQEKPICRYTPPERISKTVLLTEHIPLQRPPSPRYPLRYVSSRLENTNSVDDTRKYVATIRRTLRPGGVWINCGPLHWHKQSALALSLDEMLALVAGSGFRLEEVERLPPCSYRVKADSARSLRVDEFKPVFWVAVLEGTYAGN